MPQAKCSDRISNPTTMMVNVAHVAAVAAAVNKALGGIRVFFIPPAHVFFQAAF